jgi:5-enolpyruvylshikimate-3-phosphate synthase
MAFGLLTLVEPEITIVDPGCVSKTWPQFFSELKRYAPAT